MTTPPRNPTANYLICPHCKSCVRSEVRDSRPHEGFIRRRRRCEECANTFATLEFPEGELMSQAEARALRKEMLQHLATAAHSIEAIDAD